MSVSDKIARLAAAEGVSFQRAAEIIGARGGAKAWRPYTGGAWKKAVSAKLRKMRMEYGAKLNQAALDDVMIADAGLTGGEPTYHQAAREFMLEAARRKKR